MVAAAGRKLRIKYDPGTGAVVIAGARTDSFSIANESINISDKDDAGVQVLLNDIGTQSLSMTIEGVLKDATLLALTAGAGEGTSLHDFEIDVIGLGTVTAADGFFLSNFDPSGAEGTDPTTFSCSLTSSGAITFTAA